MTERNLLVCPRCNGPMEPGIILDRGHYSVPTEATWVEGQPERSFWTGLKLKGKESYPVRSYRCEECGYLELYARPVSKE